MLNETSTGHKRRIWIWIACLAILLFCELFFFRNIIGTDRLIGDDGDGRLTMLVTEHWYHVFCGKASVKDLNIFFPAENTIAYSDMLLGYGIIHSFLRFLGMNIYLAYRLTIVLVHITGVITLFILLKTVFDTDYGWALFGAITAFSGTAYALYIGHTQLIAVGFVPGACILFAKAVRPGIARWKRVAFMEAAIAQCILILYTAWYIFLFSAIFLGILALAELVVILWKRRDLLGIVKNEYRNFLPECLLYVLSFAIMAVPFVLLELPLLKVSGGRQYETISVFMPTVTDLFNVSEKNWLAGGLIEKLGISRLGLQLEPKPGFNIIIWLVLAIETVLLIKRRKTMRKDDFSVYFLIAAFAVVFICCLLPIRFGETARSLWWIVYHIVPGASSIRAMCRFLVFMTLPVSVILSKTGDYLNKHSEHYHPGSARYHFCMCGLIIAMFIANITNMGVTSSWNARKETEFMDSVPAPPDDCAVFWLSNPNNERAGAPFYQLDAHMISDRFGIPTINGYSGLTPREWECIDPSSDNYTEGVMKWGLDHNLEHVYSYDESNHIWKKTNFVADYALDAQTGTIPEYISGLWTYDPTEEFVWTRNKVRMVLKDQDVTLHGLKVKIGVLAQNYLEQNPKLKPQLDVFVNGELLESLPVEDGISEYVFAPEKAVNDTYDIEISTNCSFVPKDIGINADERQLSLQLYYLGAA